MNTSAWASMVRRMARSSSLLRSRQTDSLPRFSQTKYALPPFTWRIVPTREVAFGTLHLDHTGAGVRQLA